MSTYYNGLSLRGGVRIPAPSERALEIIKTSGLVGHPLRSLISGFRKYIKSAFYVWRPPSHPLPSLVISLVAAVHTLHAPVFTPRSTYAVLPSPTVVCFDAKINFDDNAEFRQKDVFAMDDMTESDPLEMEAAKWDLKYIGLDGNIACFGTSRKWKRADFFFAQRVRQAVNELDLFLAKRL